jgi:uncharacterized membrane protein
MIDPKTLAKSSAWPVAGGLVLGLGIFAVLYGFVLYIIQPFFSLLNSKGHPGYIEVGDYIHIGCGPFLGACIIGVLSVVVGGFMLTMSKKD